MSSPSYHVTMIDNDPSFLDGLSQFFERNFKTTTFQNPEKAIKFIKHAHTDGVLLDLHLEGTGGFSLCDTIRSFNPDLPIFFLSSDITADNIAEGLDHGGNDFFAKSMSVEELTARVLSRIRSCQRIKRPKTIYNYGDLILDENDKSLTIDKAPMILSPKEYEILKYFMMYPNQNISKTDLLDALWKGINVNSNNIDTHIFHLRKKMATSRTRIMTKKSVGFILKDQNGMVV